MTAQLAPLYTKALLQGDQRKFEIVLINYDNNEALQLRYMEKSKISFPSVRLSDVPMSAFTTAYEARSMPTLVAVRPDGTLITDDREQVLEMLRADLK